MVFSDKCPHCGEETDVEKPYEGMFGGDDVVEYQQDCQKCDEPLVGIFKVEYVLQEVRAA
jgi:hypothetical protein